MKDDPKRFAKAIERAIELVPKYVPLTDRNPTPSGGTVCMTATGVLVAARAFLEALVEADDKPDKPGPK